MTATDEYQHRDYVRAGANCATAEHMTEDCDDFDPGSFHDDGRQGIYCSNCRQILIAWAD
jgi:hypothetical protein